MKKYLYVIIITILLVVALFVITKNQSSESSVSQTEVSINDQVKSVDGQIIDVRTADEYSISHANGAVNIPLDEILNGDLSAINKDKPIYLYCRSGSRAEQAKNFLENSGYKTVVNIGGISDWQEKGGPVCSSSEMSCSNEEVK